MCQYSWVLTYDLTANEGRMKCVDMSQRSPGELKLGILWLYGQCLKILHHQDIPSYPFCVCILAHLLTCCLSMTQFTHWVLFDSATAAVDVAAVVGYLPPTHQPSHRPKVLIGKVPASSCCSAPLHHCTLLNPATGHHCVMVIRMADVIALHAL